MTLSFSELKRSSSNSFEKLNQELSKLNTNNRSNDRDDRMWSCQTDKSGNGYAVIRFLPAPAGEDVPFVRIWSHGFKGTGGWYIENSLTTLGQQDPIGELNSRLWNTGNKADQDTVRKQKRQLNYYSNVYVVKDPANPENEGKVFLFRYGKKIFDKLQELMTPEFEDESPVNPFDLWAGANFKLKIRKVEGYTNYDKSEFEAPGPLFDDDDKLEATWKSEYSLQELLDPKNFKSYDELKARLDKALGAGAAAPTQRRVDEEESLPWNEPAEQKRAEASPVKEASAPAFDDDDEDLAFFKKLADED